MGAACRAVLADVAPLGVERVKLGDAFDRVLAENVTSPVALPPWDNSSMDGYAVRADDVRGATRDSPRELRVTGTIAAGAVSGLRVGPGEAIRIMTGGPVPFGADSVVRIEDTDGGTVTVKVVADRDCLRNVRPKAEDLNVGDIAVAAGTQLAAGHVGVLASVGCAVVPVHRRPRVAILASGDELVDVEQFDQVKAGRKIVSSNSYSLAAAVIEAGGVPVPLGTVRDDPAALKARLSSIDCDVLVTSGGVSVGAFDYTRPVLDELGLTPRFWRVKIRPGGPMAFGLLGAKPWFGLPGNPVSVLVTFEVFVRPAIRRMSGLALPYRRPRRVRLAEAVTAGGALTHFMRATIVEDGDQPLVRLTGSQGSGLLTSMARADALLIVPPHQATADAGATLDALMLQASRHAAEPPV